MQPASQRASQPPRQPASRQRNAVRWWVLLAMLRTVCALSMLLPGEALNNDLHTYNRYGVQLNRKVPLWGGFTGKGDFAFRLWSENLKLDSDIWAHHIGDAVKRAASGRNIWHDNEKFLKQPKVYARHGLTMRCFPPASGA